VVAEPALDALTARASGHYPPRVFVLSGPSAGGKDSALLRLRQEQVPMHIVVTFTTRPPRDTETDGVEYRFVSREQFEALLARGEFLEHTEYAGNLYGTPKGSVRDALERGEDVLLKIEVEGAAAVRQQIPSAVHIFITPPSLAELEWRMRGRRTESEESLRRRLETAARELARIPEYDYLVVNHRDRLDDAVAEIRHIIAAERCRVNTPRIVL
jgi:guanylate kinase